MDNRPIGVFDSGLGGLTAVKELQALLPSEDIIYFGDTGRQPYGTRSEETIRRYALADMNFLLEHQIKRVIVACGTVSAVALEYLRERYRIPVQGVIDAATPAAAAATRNGRVGIIGTAATVRSNAYVKLLERCDSRIQTVSVACPLLVPLVENGRWRSDDIVVRTVLEEYLAKILDFGADTLILGCTHYPLLADAIRAIVGGGVRLIDPGAEDGTAADPSRKGSLCLYVSDNDDGFAERARSFLHMDVTGLCRRVDIDLY